MPAKLLLLFVILIASCGDAAQTVAYWRFEEGTNGWVNDHYQTDWYYDSSGNGNYMQTYNADTSPLYTNEIPFGNVPVTEADNKLALKFTPYDDLYSWGVDINSHDFSSGWTIEAMVKFIDTNGYQTVVGKDGQPREGMAEDPLFSTFALKHIRHNGKLELEFIDGNKNLHLIESSIVISPGIWYFVAAVCNGNKAEFYIKRPGESYELQGRETGVSGGALFNENRVWTIGRGRWDGYNADWVTAYIDEVRISDGALNLTNFLGYDVQCDASMWSTEQIITDSLANARLDVKFASGKPNVMMRAAGEDMPAYFFRQNDNGDFVKYPLGNSYNPNGGDKSFAMRVGSDDKIRIAICGPGGSPDRDHVLFGTETSPGSSIFSWEEVVSSDNWPNQLGFCLDKNNKAYIVLKHQPTGRCAVFDNSSGNWQSNYFSVIDPDYPRAAVAVDDYNNAWVIFNGRHSGTNYIEMWSNAGGAWAFSEYLTNAPYGNYEGCYFLQSVAGFDFKPDGTAVFAMKPDWWSSDLEIWYGKQIPEPFLSTFVLLLCLKSFKIRPKRILFE